MNKEIKINPDLFKMKKTLKKKTLTGTEIKKALLQTINADPILIWVGTIVKWVDPVKATINILYKIEININNKRRYNELF